jgi:hypothetical protein
MDALCDYSTQAAARQSVALPLNVERSRGEEGGGEEDEGMVEEGVCVWRGTRIDTGRKRQRRE